jgi:hypothetical protein
VAKRKKRVAAIDIGTNSIHMIIAEALVRGGYRIIDKSKSGEYAAIEVSEWDKHSQKYELMGTVTFTRDDAKAANLINKPTWVKHFDDMAWSRAVSRAFRRYAPQSGLGLYTPDEVENFVTVEPIRTDAKGSPSAPKLQSEDIKRVVAKVETVVATEPQPEPADQDVEATVEYLFGGDDSIDERTAPEDSEIMDPNSVVDILDAEVASMPAVEDPKPPKVRKEKVKAEPQAQTPPPTAATEPLWKILNVKLAEGGKSYITVEAASTLDGEVKGFWCSQPKVISAIDRAFGEHKLVKLTVKGRQISGVDVSEIGG